jgi:hypothetical protein
MVDAPWSSGMVSLGPDIYRRLGLGIDFEPQLLARPNGQPLPSLHQAGPDTNPLARPFNACASGSKRRRHRLGPT